MQKVILFPGALRSTTSASSELKSGDMNWPKKVQEIQESKARELKELLRPKYMELIKKLNQATVDSDRSRFLEEVRLSNEFEKKTGIQMEFNVEIDTANYQDCWHDISPICEVVCCDFTNRLGQLSFAV